MWQGLTGDIADGNFFLGGRVRNISSNGFRISDLPSHFTAGPRNYTTVISAERRHFRLVATPCWIESTDDNRYMDAGFKIIEAPWEWTEFVLDAGLVNGLRPRCSSRI